jgi:hypothetical protein
MVWSRLRGMLPPPPPLDGRSCLGRDACAGWREGAWAGRVAGAGCRRLSFPRV